MLFLIPALGLTSDITESEDILEISYNLRVCNVVTTSSIFWLSPRQGYLGFIDNRLKHGRLAWRLCINKLTLKRIFATQIHKAKHLSGKAAYRRSRRLEQDAIAACNYCSNNVALRFTGYVHLIRYVASAPLFPISHVECASSLRSKHI